MRNHGEGVSGSNLSQTQSHQAWNQVDWSRGSAALLSLFDGLDVLDAFEVKNLALLQKGLKDLVRQRGLGVQQNLRHGVEQGSEGTPR